MEKKQDQHGIEKVKAALQNNRWVVFYFSTLILVIVLGKLITSTLPLVQSSMPSEDVFTYESVAPGWMSSPLPRSFFEPWVRWDTVWYLKVAVEGFDASSLHIAFPPVYPMLIRMVGQLLGGQYLLAALLISWGSLFGACYLLNQRIQAHYQDVDAANAVRNMLFFPTAIFFFAGYTESFFLLLVLLAWRNADRGNWWRMGLIGALLPLTRFVGVFLVFPFGYIWWQHHQHELEDVLSSIYAFIPIPIAYFWWVDYTTSLFHITPAEATAQGWGMRIAWPWVGVIGSIRKIISNPISQSFHAYIDVLAVCVALVAIVWWLKRKKYPEVLYVASILLITTVRISELGILGSTSRILLPLFPMYLVQPSFLKHPVLKRVFLVLMILVWLFGTAMFFTWNWLA
jgi:hypothetical protein